MKNVSLLLPASRGPLPSTSVCDVLESQEQPHAQGHGQPTMIRCELDTVVVGAYECSKLTAAAETSAPPAASDRRVEESMARDAGATRVPPARPSFVSLASECSGKHASGSAKPEDGSQGGRFAVQLQSLACLRRRDTSGQAPRTIARLKDDRVLEDEVVT